MTDDMTSKPFFNGDALAAASNPPEWPAGTEVVAYCWAEDREQVARQVEQMGYQLVHTFDVVPPVSVLVKRGQCILAKRERIAWLNPSPITALEARNNMMQYIYRPIE